MVEIVVPTLPIRNLIPHVTALKGRLLKRFCPQECSIAAPQKTNPTCPERVTFSLPPCLSFLFCYYFFSLPSQTTQQEMPYQVLNSQHKLPSLSGPINFWSV